MKSMRESIVKTFAEVLQSFCTKYEGVFKKGRFIEGLIHLPDSRYPNPGGGFAKYRRNIERIARSLGLEFIEEMGCFYEGDLKMESLMGTE